MQIEITADDVFGEYKKHVSDLTHELIMEKAKVAKLLAIVEENEKLAATRALPMRQLGQPAAAPQTAGNMPEPARLPESVPEPPPLPPGPDSGPSRPGT